MGKKQNFVLMDILIEFPSGSMHHHYRHLKHVIKKWKFFLHFCSFIFPEIHHIQSMNNEYVILQKTKKRENSAFGIQFKKIVMESKNFLVFWWFYYMIIIIIFVVLHHGKINFISQFFVRYSFRKKLSIQTLLLLLFPTNGFEF